MSLATAAQILGGIGLFLLGMRLMTEGLKLAAGSALREILARSTRTRLRGLASGFLVTAIVQSSSAITVATIGFVNAGLLSLGQAVAVTWGSNIGTTMTGWLVATVGFGVNVRALALPLIGLGMALRLVSRRGRLGPLGEALAGFGLFFLGIDALKEAFLGLDDRIELATLVGAGPLRAFLLVAVGFLLTLLMQSSSAAIAIILTATSGGAVPLGSGAALVVGANVGTTSTAALAVIGATPNAKRVAASHVAFNALTGAVSLALLPLLLLAIVRGRELFDLGAEPAAVLAAFHTLFNLLGVALMWPLARPLQGFLERRFRTGEEEESRPRFLDRHVLETPEFAFDALGLELARVGQLARRLATTALSGAAGESAALEAGRSALDRLLAAVGDFTQQLQGRRLPAELERRLPTAVRVIRHYSEAGELATLVAAGRPRLDDLGAGPGAARARDFVAATRDRIERTGVDRPDYRPEAAAEAIVRLEADYRTLKSDLLASGVGGTRTVQDLVALLDWLSNVRRLVRQIERGARALAGLADRGTDDDDDDRSSPTVEASETLDAEPLAEPAAAGPG